MSSAIIFGYNLLFHIMKMIKCFWVNMRTKCYAWTYWWNSLKWKRSKTIASVFNGIITYATIARQTIPFQLITKLEYDERCSRTFTFRLVSINEIFWFIMKFIWIFINNLVTNNLNNNCLMLFEVMGFFFLFFQDIFESFL